MKGKLGVGFDTFQFTPLREGRRGWMLASTSAARTFQFTPLREGRHKVKSGSTAPTAFQFTPLREGRRPANRHRLRFVNISIHAPPRGATTRRIAVRKSQSDFNSRPSARGDQNVATWLIWRGYFNSRPSARGDDGEFTENDVPFYFNSRPSARGDSWGHQRKQDVNISIHAPPRGATENPLRNFRGNRFQFTPLREGRLVLPVLPCDFCDFNSRPSARGDGKRYAISANLLFNPYKSAWLNNSATQFVEIILVIFHRIIA